MMVAIIILLVIITITSYKINLRNFNNLEINDTSPCQKCSTGTCGEIVGGVSKCEKCPLGTQADDTGLKECKKCPVGTYTQTIGTIKCKLCPEGTYNDNESGTSKESCIKCPIGKINQKIGQSSCVLAPEGSCAAVEGLTEGIICKPGEYQDKPGCSVECKKCPAGTYGTSTGATSKSKCAPCNVGTFVSVEGSDEKTDCKSCPLGKFASKNGQSECNTSQPGHYVPGVGSSDETLCEIGSQQPNNKSIACIKCPIGQFGIASGAISLKQGCEECDKGHYNDEEGQKLCTPCHKNTYAAKQGQSVCDKCDITLGQQTVKTGSIECMNCEKGTFMETTSIKTNITELTAIKTNNTESENIHKCQDNNNNTILKKNSLICTIDKLNKNFTVSFYLTPKGTLSGWSNLFRLTATNIDCCTQMDRILGMWFYSGTLRLMTAIGTKTKGNGINDAISQLKNNVKVFVEVKVSGNERIIKINNAVLNSMKIGERDEQHNVKVYASDTFYNSANAEITEFTVTNL